MAEPTYTWFIEPPNANANETFARDLPPQNFHRDIICSDGKEHNLWECSFQYARSAWISGIRFKLFNRQGTHGNQIRECTVILRKPALRRKKTKTK